MPGLELILDAIEPHPDLVAAQRVTPAEVCEAAALLGWLPGDGDRSAWPLMRSWAASGRRG